MKLLFKHILMLTAFLFTGITLQAQIKNAITTSAKVYGNCGMCKSKIEKAGAAPMNKEQPRPEHPR